MYCRDSKPPAVYGGPHLGYLEAEASGSLEFEDSQASKHSTSEYIHSPNLLKF